MSGSSKGLIGQRLIDKGLITPEQLDVCLQQQRVLSATRGTRIRIGDLLVRARFCSADDILRVEAEKQGVAQNVEEVLAPGALLPVNICARYGVEPVEVSGVSLIVNGYKTLNLSQRRQLVAACSTRVQDVRVRPVERRYIHEYVERSRGLQRFQAALERLTKDADHSPTLLMSAVDALLREAVLRRASDIHIENRPDPNAWIKFRIDGQVIHSHLSDERVMGPLFARLKAESGMDASNSRTQQDGRIGRTIDNKTIGFRVSTLPLVSGESMVLRVLDGSRLPTIDALFPAQPVMHQLFHRIKNRQGKSGGLILITGPTGSGKSTTLYATLSSLNRTDINIVTVEDPVEFELPFIKQVQVEAMAGQQAVHLERALLRQDPDVIVMGESRDADSARAALKFAESGHLVFTTLHANSAEQAIERFCSLLGVSNREEVAFLLSTTLLAVINQSLLPKLCECSKEMVTPAERQFEVGGKYFGKVRVAGGCKKCNTGYLGRVAAHETLVVGLTSTDREEVARSIAQTGSFSALLDHPRMHKISRIEVAQTLLEAGIIDVQNAKSVAAVLDVNKEQAIHRLEGGHA